MGSLIFNYLNPQQKLNNNNLINQFNQFRSMFNGDPQAQVQQLINSGRMTQEQFKQYAELANQLRPLIK